MVGGDFMLLKEILNDYDVETLERNNVDVDKEYITKDDFKELFKKLFTISFNGMAQAERINDSIKDTSEYKKANAQ